MVYKIGNTIKKDTKIESLEEFNQNNAKIVNEATGIAFIIRIGSDIKVCKNSEADAKTANNVPKNIPSKKPLTILPREVKIL